MTLLDTLARMKMAIQAAISDAFKTPEVIGMFTQKQPGQLRQRLLALGLQLFCQSGRTLTSLPPVADQAVKLRKITHESYNDQRVEVLSALQKLGEELSTQETQVKSFLSRGDHSLSLCLLFSLSLIHSAAVLGAAHDACNAGL